jgi:molybdate transport system substrate-binding protein
MRLVLILLVVLSTYGNCFGSDLKVYSGAGLIKPMEDLRHNFERRNKVRLEVHYGGAGELFGLISMGQPCDVFIPGAAKYAMDALKNGWVLKKSIRRLVRHVPVIAVPKGNPAHITGLMDLAGLDIRVAVGDPKGPAIGKVAKKILVKNGIYEQVKPNIVVHTPTVNQLLVYVTLNQVDAAIIWEDLLNWTEAAGKVEAVRIADRRNIIKTIPTTVGSQAADNELAFKFNDYISSPEGLAVWKKWGFEPCAD